MIEGLRGREEVGHPRPFVEQLVVLDDDPTGVQTLAGIRVLLAWDAARIVAALAGRPGVHLITNSRALTPADAGALVADTARLVLEAVPAAHLVLRGDSTLRGHLLEEYEALRGALAPDSWPVLLLVPALPSAGRVTHGGVHMIERNGESTPLDGTEYARDGVFSYSTARLLGWAEERSAGLFAAANGREIHLDELRRDGPRVVADALGELASNDRPAVLAPDAETGEDLTLIAGGYAAAIRAGVTALVRCAPAFAGILAGTTASRLVDPPLSSEGGVLLVCGSYVPATTRQLGALATARPGTLVVVEADALAGPDAEVEVEVARVTAAASAVLRREQLAVIATSRTRSEQTSGLAIGERIAAGLARIAGQVEPRPPIIIAKGGITSAVTLQTGLGVDVADVVGPVLPGVSLWHAQAGGRPLDYLVVPGNVGDDDLLVRLVDTVTRAESPGG
jgi:uncharacterized protein YgbK (DUF1537 family)